MAQTFLIFDFGTDEEAAQKARHRIDGWKQAFHLDRKMLVRFEREAAGPADASITDATDAKASAKTKKSAETAAAPDEVHLLVRLDFSDHEKLSHQRWLERIPTDEAFKSAKHEIIGHNDGNFEATTKRFEELESEAAPPRAR